MDKVQTKVATLVTKDKTLIIKGLAILFMIAHHVLIKEFYIEPSEFLSSLVAIRVQIAMKMCVGLFTFFVGYGAFYAVKIDYKYIRQHAWRLLKQYWIVLFFSVLIVSLSSRESGWNSTVLWDNSLILNLLGFNHQYNLGNWYIYFYLYALCVLPLIIRVFQKRTWGRLILFTIVFGIMAYFIRGNHFYVQAVDECVGYTPTLAIGYICAKTDILSVFCNRVRNKIIWILIVSLVLVFRSYASEIIGIKTDVICVPVFVMAVSALFLQHETTIFAKIMTVLGRNSTLIWFIHAIPLSDSTRRLFQTCSLWPNNLLILYIVLTLVSLVLSIMGNYFFEKTNIIKKR